MMFNYPNQIINLKAPAQFESEYLKEDSSIHKGDSIHHSKELSPVNSSPRRNKYRK